MRRLDRRPRHTEDGAVAILTAVLAVVLLLVAAMAVDLGNAWARKQDVQSQVDLAALSAAQLLPRDASNEGDVVDEVVKYLNTTNNAVPGQTAVTSSDLTDGAPENGEVTFDSDTRIRVLAPFATVKFGLAGAAGFNDTDVTADATVELQSLLPPMQEVLPFALPSGCPYGPGMADTGPGGGGASFTPSPGQTGDHTLTNVTSSPSPVAEASTAWSVTFTVGNLPKNSTGGILRFHLDSTEVSYTATWPDTGNTQGLSRTVTVPVSDTQVSGTAGTWLAWVVIGNGSGKYSTSGATITVAPYSPAAPSVGCSTSASGNFGQLDSPGWGNPGKNQLFAHNIARGLDHLVVPFTTATADVCADNSGHNPIPDAQLDTASVPYNNCLNVDPGNDGSWIMRGLVTGIDGHRGRLDVANGHTKAGCGTDLTIAGTTVNNDRLSCYLRNGASLADITNADNSLVSESMIDPAITQSPRFVWLPVFRSPVRINDKWQPIKMFVPGMITGETLDGSSNPSDSDGDGIVWSGQKITSLQVFTFNPNVLPVDERSPSVAYNPALPPITRLVD